ncbi:MAG: NAD(P)/FAD-dependent oxidoreductase [Pseudonocardia sp.]
MTGPTVIDPVAAQGDVAVDVAVVGGGAAGLTLALQLRQGRPDLRILVLERQAHPVPEAAHKVGESTVEIAGYYLREILGLGEHLEGQQLRKFGLRMFFSDRDNQDIARRIELGHSVTPPAAVGTYQIDRGRFENALAKRLAGAGIDIRTGTVAERIELGPGDADHAVVFRDDIGAQRTVRARWVIDATGRNGMLKKNLGLAKPVGHRANAVWLRVDAAIDVATWSDDPAWQARIRESRRELSTNHLMGSGYWVWLIRLASGATSVGIVTDPERHDFAELNRLPRALAWLREHEPQCAAAVAAAIDRVQDFRVMKDYAYSCRQVFSGDRWCLAGEAGVFLDPLYSPGLDLVAISNGLITDLVLRSLDGEDVAELAAIHNSAFLLVVDGWMHVYENQYAVMGNARVMLTKVVWDTAVYWAVVGLLYFQDKFRVLVDMPDVLENLARFSAMSKTAQRFFREWASLDAPARQVREFVQFYDFDFMKSLHAGMTLDLTDDEFVETFAANVSLIEQLTGQLINAVCAELAADPEPVAVDTAARWRADPLLAALIAQAEHCGSAVPEAQWISRLTPSPA